MANQSYLVRSNFVERAQCDDSQKQKRQIDDLLAAHAARLLPDLEAELAWAGGRRIVLLLDAPGCSTSKALAARFPALATSGRLVVPQADREHYNEMVADPQVQFYASNV